MSTSLKSDRMVVLYYSQKAEKLFGSTVSSVPDGRGGKKEAIYTCCHPADSSSSYDMDDKCVVWKGPEADIQIISCRKPAQSTPRLF